ncbi:MAG: hypothetical protein QG626_895 [Patescibacteria group bacterium]|nr:hypothetical protein [Patescibacteria group bacterium]
MSQNLTIQADICFLEHVNKARIAESVGTYSGVDLERPEAAEVALLGATIAESVLTGLQHGWAGKTNLALAAPFEALNALQEVLAALNVLCTAFYSWHTLGVTVRK